MPVHQPKVGITSVINGAPAAAVVFAGKVDARTAADPRVLELEARLAAVAGAERAARDRAFAAARQGRRGVRRRPQHRSRRCHGSVDAISAASTLRPQLIAAVERGMSRR